MPQNLKITSSGKGTPLVLIHGWGLNSGVWQPLIPALSEKFQVITIDLPGFGINHDFILEDYSIENIAKLVEQSLDEPAVILGWSLGGLVASQLALAFPHKVKAIISVASSPHFVANDDWAGIEPIVLKGFYKLLSEDTAKTIDNFLKIQAMGSPHIRADVKKTKELIMQYPMPNKDTLMRALALLENVDLRAQLHRIECPFLRMYGRLDSLVPKASIENIEQLVPNSDSYVFEKASHAPFISHEEEFSEALITWVQNL